MEENQIIVDVGLDAFIESLRHLQKQYELNTAALKAMKDAGEEQSDAYIMLTQEQKVLRQQIASTEKAMQNEIKMQQAQEGSLVQLRAQLANLQKQYDSMSGMERMGEAGTALQKRIKALHDEVLGLEGDTGRMQRNVGNYPAAVQPLIEELERLTKQLEDLRAENKEGSDEFAAVEKRIGEVNQSITQLTGKVEGLATDTGNVKQQMRELTENLIAMRMRGEENTEQYRQMLEQLGNMKDAIEDTNAQVKQMASDTGALNSVLQGAQAAAGGFSVALGVMNLVGDKDSETAKELAEAQAKLQSAIAITTGLQALQNALQKESALMMGVNKIRMLAAAAAQRAYAAATRDAEAAQAVFNKVAKSNIYVWLASIILTVVGAIAAFTRGSKEQKEQIEETNLDLMNQVDVLKRLQDGYVNLNRRVEENIAANIEQAKIQGKSKEEIRALEDALYKKQLERMKKEKEGMQDQLDAVTKYEARYQDAMTKIRELDERYMEALRQGDTEKAEFYMREINNLNETAKAIEKRLNAVNDFNARWNQLLLEQQQRIADRAKEEEEAARQAAAAAKQRAQEAKARREEERRKQKEYADLTLSEEQKAEDARNELIENEFERRRAIEDTAYSRQLAALEQSMADEEKAHGKNTALYASYLDQIESLRRQHINTMSEIAKDEFDEEQVFNEFRLQALKELKEELASMEDETEEAQVSKMQKFAEAYKENAQAIQETSTALQSSFGSMSSMYKQMAQDESKTEAEREAAAKKARAWSALQIAANAGTAVAKGVASAMDTPWPANIAAIATTLASVLSAIAQAKALLAEAHEYGGVIGGKFVGATSGSDNVLMTGRRGELVLNADQQKRLYDIANGSASSNLTASLVEALQAMPAPVLVYSELKRFENNVNILDELSNLN